MSTIILDDCLYYLIEGQKCINAYKEIDSFLEIFEADNPEVQATADNNAKAGTGAVSNLKKAATAVLNMIRKIIDSIVDFFQKRTMDTQEREAYEKFKEAAKQDPSLKNKKITVKDFRALTKEYDALLKEVEEQERLVAAGKEGDFDALTKKITTFCGNAAKGVAVSVSAEAALRMASSSREIADKMYKQLKNDEKLQQEMINTIGAKETKKLEKDMKSLSSKFYPMVALKRWKMKMAGTYAKSCEEAVASTFQDVENLIKSGLNLGNTFKSTPEEVMTQNKLQRGVSTAKKAFDNRKQVTKDAKVVAKNKGMINRMAGNKEIRQGVQTGMDMTNTVQKNMREKYKAENKKSLFPKKKIVQDQSAKDAILGKNDPNSIYNKTIGKTALSKII